MTLAPDSVQTVAPRSYTSVTVYSGATLNLTQGEYYFDSLDLEPQAKVSFGSQSVRIAVRSNLNFRGSSVFQCATQP